MKELQKIKEAVWRANPEIQKAYSVAEIFGESGQLTDGRKLYKAKIYHGREIRLADILLATGHDIAVVGNGCLLKYEFGDWRNRNDITWNLKENLDWHAINRPEVIKFLAKLL